VLKAMEMFKDCSITFVERTNEVDYIEILDEGGYWSSLGRVGGRQVCVFIITTVGHIL